jgi:hypothetical protein
MLFELPSPLLLLRHAAVDLHLASGLIDHLNASLCGWLFAAAAETDWR